VGKRPYTYPQNLSELRSRAARARWGPKDDHRRFWSKVNKEGPVVEGHGPCWIWTGAKSAAGYGQLRTGDTLFYAHRLAYEELVGPIPEDRELDHLCGNRGCVNPAHMEAVSHAENMTRWRGVPIDQCIRGHDLRQARINKRGVRVCRICMRDYMRARRARMKEEKHGY
jgi:HNH endonuclease